MKQAGRILQKSGRREGEPGSVFVEFTLVLPVLLLFYLAAIEFGLAFREHQILQNAVREAARLSSLPVNEAPLSDPNRDAKMMAIKQRVIDYCSAEKVSPPVAAGEITIDQNYPIAIDANVTVRGSQVSVVHIHPLLTGAAFLPGGGVLTLQASAVFRNMY